MDPVVARRAALMLAVLYALGFSNLLLRSSLGVLAPVLRTELGLSPAELGTIASAFFWVYAAMQVPTGIFLDRFGPRATLASMLVVTAAGAAVFALGRDAAELGLGRGLMGFGTAGVFTGAAYLVARWYPPERFPAQMGTLNSVSTLGTFCAATPLALLAAAIGWRSSFAGFALAVALIAVAAWLVLRDSPPGAAPPLSRAEGMGQVLHGLEAALRARGIPRVATVGLAISAFSTLVGAWGPPYLRDVHGLDALARGNVLVAMAFASVAGHWAFGRLAGRLDSYKRPIQAATLIVAAAMAVLALVPGLPLPLAVAAFCVVAFGSSFPTVAHGHAKALVPDHLMGRGLSVVNTGMMLAIAVMQLVFGRVIELFPRAADDAWTEPAFRAAFAAQAAAALVAFAVYWPVRDARPRG